MERSGTRWLLNGNGRYRSLPFPITIPFLVIASSFFFHIHPRGFFVSGVQPLLLLAHFFELDYRDHDWSVRFSIVAKVLIKSGRSKLYPCIESRITSFLRARQSWKTWSPIVVWNSIRRKGKNSFPLEIDREGRDVGKEDFLEYLSKDGSLESWKSAVCFVVLFTTRVSPPPLSKEKKLWSHWHCAVSFTRGSPSSFQIVVYFLERRLANSDKESLSRSTCLPPN